VSSFYTPFGGTGFCTDSLDVQFMHGSPKLDMPVSACGVFIVNTKNTGFIAVQCQRFTMLIDIAPRGEVRKRGLRFNKQQFHQFAGASST
jgi:hypothetical protein